MQLTEEKIAYLAEEVDPYLPDQARTVAPVCPVFDRCGGCHLQHLPYEQQLEVKANILGKALASNGVTLPDPGPRVEGMAEPLGYRNKVDFNARTFDGAIHLGFLPIGSRILVEAQTCPICLPSINEALGTMRTVLQNHLVLKHKLISVVLRTTVAHGKVVILYHSKLRRPEIYADVSRDAMAACESIQGGLFAARRKSHPTGSITLEETIRGHRYAYSPQCFFQVNPVQTEVLADHVLDYLEPTTDDIVLDLYSGVGLFTLLVAPHVKQVFAVEDTRQAVEYARANVEGAGLSNVQLLRGQVEERIEQLYNTATIPTAVILDPPRSGCRQNVLDRIAGYDPSPRILMVSCNPKTFARDLARLVEHGYRIERLSGVDMFPQTISLESVALLRKGS